MKRLTLFAAMAFVTGCSNAPVAGFLDNCFPSRVKSDTAPEPPPRPVGDPFRPAPGPPIPPPDFRPPQ